MPELEPQGNFTIDPGVYKNTYIGTAAGTTTISNFPAFLSHITVLQRAAIGTLTWYDSVGTSGTATTLGTYIMGTQTNTDVPPTILIKGNTKTALTVVNTAGVAALIAYLP